MTPAAVRLRRVSCGVTAAARPSSSHTSSSTARATSRGEANQRPRRPDLPDRQRTAQRAEGDAL
eukprot:15456114-Alexandrium_andersonii.AAC.1